MPREFVVDNYRKTYYKKEVNDFVDPVNLTDSYVYNMHKAGNNFFLCGSNKLLIKYDGQVTSSINTSTFTGNDIHSVYSASDGIYICADNTNGFKKYNGTNWTTISNSEHFCVTSCSQGIFVGKDWGGSTLGKWDGQNLTYIGSNTAPIYTIYSASTGIYYGGESGTLWRFDGSNHTNLSIGGTHHIEDIVEDPTDNNLYITTGLYYTTYVYKKNVTNNTHTQIGDAISGHAQTIFIKDYLYVGGPISGVLKRYKDNTWQNVSGFDRPNSNAGAWSVDKSEVVNIYIAGNFSYNSVPCNIINFKNMIVDEESNESPPLFIQRTTSVPALRLNSPYRTNTG